MPPQPIYTAENCTFACPLQWDLTVFWRTAPGADDWFADLSQSLEPDGIRLLGHRFESPAVSQFAISTTPDVAPLLIVQRVKGRLQYLVRSQWPKPFRGNYALRSFGKVTREVVESYVANQLDHHRMADPRVEERLRRYQVLNEEVDLSQPQQTSQGLFWHNLHIVLVHRERWVDVREEALRGVQQMIMAFARRKRCLLSRAGILADHVHLTLGCPLDVAPREIALALLNNLAYVHGMKPLYQYGGFVGTFGEYNSAAVRSQTKRGGDQPADSG